MELKKNPKIEVGRNSNIYFLIGINLMLFLTWQSFEYKSYDKVEIKQEYLALAEDFEEDIPITNLNTPPPPPPPAELAAPEEITVVEDEEDVEETVIESTETSQDEYIEEKEVVEIEDVVVEEIEEDIEVAFAVVENVPIFPGCTGSNNDLKKCFNEKVLAHVKSTFKYPKTAEELNIQGKVYVMFIVDNKGKISNIKTRGPNKILESEARRIITALPRMTPGKQRGNPVNVPYAIPINFKLAL